MSPDVAETHAQPSATWSARRSTAEADWAGLAAAGLLSLPVPEEYGGEGLGLAEVAVLLREVGRRAGQLPVWETLCCGALDPGRGRRSDEQQQRLLPGRRERRRAPHARRARGRRRDPGAPATTLADGRLTGRKIGVTLRRGRRRAARAGARRRPRSSSRSSTRRPTA